MEHPFKFKSENNYSIIWDDQKKCFILNLLNGQLIYYPNFFSLNKSNKLLHYFLETKKNIKWNQDVIRFFGKKILLPRLTSWYGEPNLTYTYSGIKMTSNSWHKTILLDINKRLENKTGHKFNSVLLNLYKDGNDYQGWHADDEAELGKTPVIASLSFGAERDFCFKSKTGESKFSLLLNNGSLIIMEGEIQQNWKHALPKRKKIKTPRVNLTYRLII
jgi:alkylated DNA repair dioxygenase AlkB